MYSLKRLQDVVMAAVNAVDPSHKQALLANVIFTGNTMRTEGFVARLTSEIETLAGQSINVRNSNELFKNHPLRGVSGLVNSMLKDEQYMTMDDFEKHGAGYIHKTVQFDN